MAEMIRSAKEWRGAVALFVAVVLLSQSGGRGRAGPPLGEQAEPPVDKLTPPVSRRKYKDPRHQNEANASQVDSKTLDLAAAVEWHFSLLRERALEIRLRNAQKDLDAGRSHSALATLHEVLTSPHDGFVQVSAELPPSGAKWTASRMLDNLSAEARALNATLYDGEASRMLAAAKPADEFRCLEQVFERYFHTPTGGEAGRRLANTWMDRGAFAIASNYWCRLWRDALHQRTLDESDRLRAMTCLEASGQHEVATQIGRVLAAVDVRLAGKPVDPDDRQRRVVALQAQLGQQVAVVGGLDRNASASGSAPMLDHPRWSTGLAGETSNHITAALTLWEQHQISHALPLASSNFAVVARPRTTNTSEAGDVLLFRDYEGIRAVDLATHQQRWHYRCAGSLVRDMAPGNGAVAPSAGEADVASLTRLMIGNRTLGMLSSDGRLVYGVDELECRWNQPVNQFGQPVDIIETGRDTNALVALELSGTKAGTPRWIAGGRGKGAVNRPLAGYFFLGPPLPLAGRLYVIAEHQQELLLVCLDAETGKPHWTRGLCLPGLAVENDMQRYYMGCAPAQAEGLLICPTQLGVLVAVEAATGALRWAYAYDDAEQVERLAGWPNSSRQRYEQPGFANFPVVAQGRIVYLPAHSEQIHCVDLQTGRCCWKMRRDEVDQSTEYVAAAGKETVVVVGRRRCRGLSLPDGEERWSQTLAGSPAGRGAQLRGQYLIPLSHGQVDCLDLETGHRIGFSLANAKVRPGNLTVWNDEVISLGRTTVTAYPQAAAWLTKLPQESQAATEQLLSAELHLAVGETGTAKAELQRALAAEEVATGDRARHLLREVLHREFTALQAPSSRPAAASAALAATTLDQLSELSGTPEQRSRYLIRRVDFERRSGHPEVALDALQQLLTLDVDTPVALPDDAARSVDVSAWVRSCVADWTARENAESRGQLSTLATAASATTLREQELRKLSRLAVAFARLPEAADMRLGLAQRHWDQGHLHAAELQLLACRQSTAPAVQATATRLLSELWSTNGHAHAGARLLRELAEGYADISVGTGKTGREYLASLPPQDLGKQAWQRLSPPQWLIENDLPPRVSIRETREVNPLLEGVYHANQVQYRAVPRGFGFDLLDRTPTPAGELLLIDRVHGGVLNGTIALPHRYYYPVSAQNSFVGHVIPIGSPGCALGVSLLDRKVVWTTVPPGLAGLQEVVRVGPAGPEFAVFQCRHHLFVLDPSDGRVLWHRRDVQANSGLMCDPYSGLIGDEHVLVLFDADRTNYTLYETSTGAEIRRGRLDIDPRQTRRTYGRKLFHFTRDEETLRLRVWDPLTDTAVWEEAAENLASSSVQAGLRPGTRVFTFVSEADELAYVTTKGRLRVVDALTGAVRLETAVDADELPDLAFIRVFGDAERYYVNLQQIGLTTLTEINTTFTAQDTLVPATHFQGNVLAYDRSTQERVWQRDLGNRTFLQLQEYRLPVLFSLCRMRKGHQLVLEAAAVDARTGEFLASREGMLADQILQFGYDRDSLTVTLRGSRTEINLQLKPPLRQTAEFDPQTILR